VAVDKGATITTTTLLFTDEGIASGITDKSDTNTIAVYKVVITISAAV